MSGVDDTIRRMASLVGIAAGYRDQNGRTIETPFEAQAAVLKGLGLAIDTEADAEATLRRVKDGLIPALIPIPVGTPARIPLRRPQGQSAVWRIAEERGGAREGRTAVQTGEGGLELQL